MSKQLLAIGNQHQLVDWGTPQDQQISQIPSSSWLVGAVLEQPRLSLMRAWLDAAEQSWAQSTVLLVAVVSLIVRWHVSVVSLNAERAKILESFWNHYIKGAPQESFLPCSASYAVREEAVISGRMHCSCPSSLHRYSEVQLHPLLGQIWHNFRSPFLYWVSSDWLRSSKTQQRKVKNFIFLYRTGFQIIWKDMFSPL